MTMRRTLTLLAATAAVGGGAAVLAVAAPTTLNLTSQTTSQKAVFTSTEDIFQGGKKVGTDRVVCTQVSETKANCKVAVTLPKGTILATFTGTENSNSGPIKVVGGTRGYKDATGTGTYKNLNKDGTKTAITLKLQ
jgi:hypothetical protein